MNREQRLAENELLFRAVNERILEMEGDHPPEEPIDFMCECADPACTRVLSLSREEYERLRADPKHLAVLPGHQVESIERVVETHRGYLVVEKYESVLRDVEDGAPEGS
jgi:hypothetical protein